MTTWITKKMPIKIFYQREGGSAVRGLEEHQKSKPWGLWQRGEPAVWFPCPLLNLYLRFP